MSSAIRISPAEVGQKLKSGEALLVCAYQNDEKFKNNHLDGAISYGDFQEKIDNLSKEQEIVFYCA